jgi:hypothetical protein
MLEELQILLCLQEMELEVQEVILVEELERDLHPIDGWDLSAELDNARTRMDRINDEHAAKARRLSQLVVGISNVLVDMATLPV